MSEFDHENDDWNVIKSASQRERIRRRKATRNSARNKPVRVNRHGNSFKSIDNGMSEDIPTSGDGWTLK